MASKQLKKKHSSRLIGGTETGSQGGDDGQQGGRWHTKCVRQWLVDWGSEWQLMDQAISPETLRGGTV